MIVEPVRLTTLPGADAAAPMANDVLPIGLTQDVASLGAETTSGDFAATLGRSTAQGLERLRQEDGDDAVSPATEAAVLVDTSQPPDAAPVAGLPWVPVTSAVAQHVGEPPMAGDDVSATRDVSIAPTTVAPPAGDSTLVALAPMLRANESLREPVSPHIATLLAAHEHRMRGALGSHVADGTREGTVDALAPSLAPAVSTAAPMAVIPAVASPLRSASPSLAALPMAADPATPVMAPIDSGATQALRAALAPATFGNAIVSEPATAAVSGGDLSASLTAGEGAAIARSLSGRVHTMTEKGVHEARLRLTPVELGDIGIVVRKSPMQLSVSLQVARPEALSLVQGTAALLRDMLSQRHAGEVHVSVASMPSFSGDGASGNARERHSRDARSDDAGPGLALGEAAREREAFRL